MKYVKSCLIITMLLGVGYSESCGDFNQDGAYNVLDIVILAKCVLAQNCENYQCGSFCSPADVNGDGWWNVMDIVLLANCVLLLNCDE